MGPKPARHHGHTPSCPHPYSPYTQDIHNPQAHGTATQQPHPAHPREYTFPDCRAYTPAMPARSLHIPLSAKFQTSTTPQNPHRRRHCGTMPQNPLSSPTALPTSPTPDGGLSPRPDGGGRPRLASKHQLHHVRCSTRAASDIRRHPPQAPTAVPNHQSPPESPATENQASPTTPR